MNSNTAWYVAVVMACRFITFYSLPDVMTSPVRLTMMVLVQIGVGVVLKGVEKDLNDDF